MRRAALGRLAVQRGALANAEAVLLIDDRHGQGAKAHRVLDQRVRADDQRALAAGQAREQLGAARRRRRPGQQRERDRLAAEQPLDRREVLFGERLGRRHQRRLEAVLDRPQHREQRDHRLAAADLAHQQALRRALTGQLLAQDCDRRQLIGGQHERQLALQPALGEGGRVAQRQRRRGGVLASSPGEQRELHEQQLVEGETLAPALHLLGARAEVHRLERRAALGQAQARPQPSRQRLDDVLERRTLGGHEGQDLGAREPLAGGVVRDLLGLGGRLLRRRVVGNAEASVPLVLPVQHQPRAGLVALRQPRLVEERGLHRPGRIGDRRLDQRAHAAAADRPRRDRAHLDQHRRRLPRGERGHRARLAASTRHMLEQVLDGRETERCGALGGLLRQLQLALQPRAVGRSHPSREQRRP